MLGRRCEVVAELSLADLAWLLLGTSRLEDMETFHGRIFAPLCRCGFARCKSCYCVQHTVCNPARAGTEGPATICF